MEKNLTSVFLMTLIVFLAACQAEKSAQVIIDRSIQVSGGDLYQHSLIQFDFRDHQYQIDRNEGDYQMTRIGKDGEKVLKDQLTNNGFERRVSGERVTVPDSMVQKYSNSINSVCYFALLPYGLNDPAVNKTYLEEVEIKGEKYHKIQVSFDQQGGGEDFEDVYIYWISVHSSKVDYLAYSYEVNGGGLRFREAYNERFVGGIRFVDYINYKADPSSTTVDKLDQLFQNGKLEELSRIELRNVKVSTNRKD
jgi:hypothetical protein